MADLINPLNGGNFIHQDGPGPNCGSLLDRFSLKGKTAVVTGAGGGIGLSVAQAFAELGANVAIWYNTNDSAHQKADDISKRYGVKCRCKHCRHGLNAALTESRQSFQSRCDRLLVHRTCS